MRSQRFFGILAAGVAACGVLLYWNEGSAAPRKELARHIDAIAAALRKGDKDAVAELVRKAAKADHEVEHFMRLTRGRKKQGFGIGDVAGAITPDAIEDYVQLLAKNDLTADDLKKNAAALTQMGYRVAALGRVFEAQAPKKDRDKKKTKNRWITYSASLAEGGMNFADAIQAGSVADARKAAVRINSNCNSCHTVFRKHD